MESLKKDDVKVRKEGKQGRKREKEMGEKAVTRTLVSCVILGEGEEVVTDKVVVTRVRR